MASHAVSHPLTWCSQIRPFSEFILTPASRLNEISLRRGIFHTAPNHSFTVSPNYRSRFKISSSSTPRLPSSSRVASPPASREEAILQAKTCLSSTLQKSLNKPALLPTRKLKKQKQPRFQVEIPVLDDSPNSLSRLAFEVFADITLRRRGARPLILILWPDQAAAEYARGVFDSCSDSITNSDFFAADVGRLLGSVDLAVFVAPEASVLGQVRRICNDIYPKPVVLLNPKWGPEGELSLAGDLRSFVRSFDVLYSLMGLDVKGLLSKRNGFVFRCVNEGVSPEKGGWGVFVEDVDNKGQMKVVTAFDKRPEIGDVETVLYNYMAATSPVTKSVKFLKDLASNISGKKGNQ